MKKIFTLFAAAMLGLCAFAQMPETCPSELRLSVLNGEDPSQVEIELQLINSSLYLNGFFVRFYQDENVQWKSVNDNYFTAEGYANVNLARWEGVTDEEREAALNSMCDIYSGVNGFGGGELAIFEVLSTYDCLFFPVLEEPTGIGKFYLDMSGCEDGRYEIIAFKDWDCNFYYLDPVYGSYQMIPDEHISITLVKQNGVVFEEPVVTENDEFYVVGTFNGWDLREEHGRIELVENADGTQYTGEVQLEDGAEFVIVSPLITPVGHGWKWFGGVDDNQVGYFEINDGLLNQPIELVDGYGANFKVVGDGKYTITVMQPSKGLQEPLVMTVSKEATGISTIAADKVDSRIFDLQGRELKCVPEHGIYIQNGNKYVK